MCAFDGVDHSHSFNFIVRLPKQGFEFIVILHKMVAVLFAVDGLYFVGVSYLECILLFKVREVILYSLDVVNPWFSKKCDFVQQFVYGVSVVVEWKRKTTFQRIKARKSDANIPSEACKHICLGKLR